MLAGTETFRFSYCCLLIDVPSWKIHYLVLRKVR